MGNINYPYLSCISLIYCIVTAAAACSQQECSLPTEEDALMVSLMKDNKVPDKQKSRFMAETFDFRRKWIQNQERSVREILTEFPCLLEEGMVKAHRESLTYTVIKCQNPCTFPFLLICVLGCEWDYIIIII